MRSSVTHTPNARPYQRRRDSASTRRNARSVVIAVTAGATAWMLYGLIARPLPDLLGFVTWAIFIRFIVRGRYPLLYAVSFAVTTALELYGTGLGIWRWSPVLPGLLLPAGNPPTGIGAGYAAMDGLTSRVNAISPFIRRSHDSPLFGRRFH